LFSPCPILANRPRTAGSPPGRDFFLGKPASKHSSSPGFGRALSAPICPQYSSAGCQIYFFTIMTPPSYNPLKLKLDLNVLFLRPVPSLHLPWLRLAWASSSLIPPRRYLLFVVPPTRPRPPKLPLPRKLKAYLAIAQPKSGTFAKRALQAAAFCWRPFSKSARRLYRMSLFFFLRHDLPR